MEKFKKLSKDEMKNVVGGTGTCYVNCGDFGNGGYYYVVPNCSDAPFPLCGGDLSGNCECAGA